MVSYQSARLFLDPLAALALGAVSLWIWRRRVGAPDPTAGDVEEYGRGSTGPRPFCWRWLLPFLTRGRPLLWQRIGEGSLVVLPLLGWMWGGWIVAGVLAAAPGLWERTLKIVHLGDAPALVLTLLAVITPFPWNIWWAWLAGATRETSPLFGALWAWDPWLLLGILGAGWWRRGGPPHRHFHLYERPWRRFSALRWHQGMGMRYVWPLGGAIFGLASPDPRGWGSLLLALIPTFRSVDFGRLYTWAVPGLAYVTAQDFPHFWPIVLFLSIIWSSYQEA